MRLGREHCDRVHLVFVYGREAHARDERNVEYAMRDDVSIDQPRTLTERRAAAARCAEALGLTGPVAVDRLDDAVGRAYGAWPDRIHVIGPEGRVAYRGRPGPGGFDPPAVRAFLEAEYGLR